MIDWGCSEFCGISRKCESHCLLRNLGSENSRSLPLFLLSVASQTDILGSEKYSQHCGRKHSTLFRLSATSGRESAARKVPKSTCQNGTRNIPGVYHFAKIPPKVHFPGQEQELKGWASPPIYSSGTQHVKSHWMSFFSELIPKRRLLYIWSPLYGGVRSRGKSTIIWRKWRGDTLHRSGVIGGRNGSIQDENGKY